MNITGDEYQPFNAAISGTNAEMERRKRLLDAIRSARQMPPEASAQGINQMPEMDLTGGDSAVSAIGGVDENDTVPAHGELTKAQKLRENPMDGAEPSFEVPSVPPEAVKAPPLVSSQPMASTDDRALFNAQEADRRAKLRAGIELATRQFAAGVTHQPIGQMAPQEESQVPLVLSTQAARKKALADEVARQRQSRLDDTEAGLKESERIKNMAEAIKAQRELNKPEKPDEAAGMRQALRGPAYAAQLKESGVDPASLDSMSLDGLKTIATHFENGAKNVSSEKAAEIARGGALTNLKTAKVFELGLPQRPDTETRKQAEALGMVDDQIDRMSNAWDEKVSATGSGLTALIPNTKAHTYTTDERNQTKEMLVRAMSQTVPREANMAVIEPMIPTATDSKETKTEKVKNLKSYFKDQREQFYKTLAASNVNMDVSKLAPTPAGQAKTTKPSPGAGYTRALVNGKPGWINRALNDWEPD